MDKSGIFALSPGVDFAAELVRGLEHQWGDGPLDLARVELWVNTARMQRRLREVFDEGHARLVPKIRLITEFGWMPLPDVSAPIAPLRRRLELRQMVARLIEVQKGIFPRSAAFDLADGLAKLFVEMADEGVTPADIAALDVTDQSGHWQRSLEFLKIATGFTDQPDSDARQRLAVEATIRHWQENPPEHPIVMAGSTGSRGPSAMLMQAVAKLPQGAVVLPGFDFDLDGASWETLVNAPGGDDHPQFRFLKVLAQAGIKPGDVRNWTTTEPASPSRNKLVSLALRPAPVTDGWMRDGPDLGPLDPICRDLTLIEAPGPRSEALSIALCLRGAAQDGKRGALITPDRTLAQRVTAALDRWKIRPDDSAGEPLPMTAPGRLLRMVAAAFGSRLTLDELISLLNHPLVVLGDDRLEHLNRVRSLELALRGNSVLYPSQRSLEDWAETDSLKSTYVNRILPILAELETVLFGEMQDLVARHIRICQTLCGEKIWQGKAGEMAQEAMQDLSMHADDGGSLDPREYSDLISSVLQSYDVRDALTPHPSIMIWGTLEARVQSVDLAILGGLNEGAWPQTPDPDPWLSRQMRRDAGLMLPERQVGLSAHDFQQAIAAPRVVLSRAKRDDDALTVPARWLNRLTSLLAGLPETGGDKALKAMCERGDGWVEMARALEQDFEDTPTEPRPSPSPPIPARPRKLSVTRVSVLIRDPYSIYARYILDLKRLNPLRPKPDAAQKGVVIHEILHNFIADRTNGELTLTPDAFMRHADNALAQVPDWPAERRIWRAEIARAVPDFLREESIRLEKGQPIALEVGGSFVFDLPELGAFTLTGKADRVDQTPAGDLVIFDYKTGAIPSPKEQTLFDKQLYLLAILAENGALKVGATVPAAPVTGAAYLSFKPTPKHGAADMGSGMVSGVHGEFVELLTDFTGGTRGYTARSAPKHVADNGDYAQLSRFGEWSDSELPRRIEVGK